MVDPVCIRYVANSQAHHVDTILQIFRNANESVLFIEFHLPKYEIHIHRHNINILLEYCL